MTEERTSRPVSGEIMSDPARAPAEGSARHHPRDGDIIDADYETLSSATVPPRRDAPQAPAGTAGAGMEILKAGSGRESRRAGPAFWVLSLAIVAAAFWVSGGHALVSRPTPAPPPVVEPDPRAALRILGVTSRIENSGGRSFVLIDGEVVNSGKQPAVLPPLDIRVTDGAGRSTRYRLGTGERRLGPAGRFPFSGRLEVPAGGIGTVTVDFRQEAN